MLGEAGSNPAWVIKGAFHLEKKSGNFGVNFRESLYNFASNFACVEVRVALRGPPIATELILVLDEPLAADEEEMLIDSDDEEEICVIAATSIFMRRDLNRNYGFCDVIVPTYSIDELKSHFRMTRGALDILCREVAATGIIPWANRFERPPIPIKCQVLAFVWFMSNSDVMRSVSDRFDVTLSSLFRIIQRVPWAWNW